MTTLITLVVKVQCELTDTSESDAAIIIEEAITDGLEIIDESITASGVNIGWIDVKDVT